MYTLKKSEVVFDAELHTYKLGDRYLSGITGMIGRQLFPDKYTGVPQKTLRDAAERGSAIHELCQAHDLMNVMPDIEEVRNYIRIKMENNLRHEDSEYLVSDNTYFATCIDKVYRVDDNTFDLGDIKTTYKLDLQYLSWQLSICAYLFELQNPSAKVRNLYGIWLKRDKYQLVTVPRISDADVESLLCSEIDYQDLDKNLLKSNIYSLPIEYKKIEGSILNIYAELKYWEEQKKKLTDRLMQEMVKAGVYDWDGDTIKITRKKETIRKTFDKEAFDKDYPGVYEKYVKETPMAGSIIIKEKKK